MSEPTTQRYCAYPWQQMVVDLTGEVVPCCFWSGYGNTGKPLGNTNVNTVEEIWNGPGYQALRRANASGNLEGHPCRECMAYAWAGGNYPPFSSPIPWRHESGHCFIVEIPEGFAIAAGDRLAEAKLFEDGFELEHSGALHEDIRAIGAGRYSVWGGTLYFSSSDNSEPSENGRVYELRAGEHRVALKGLVLGCKSSENIQAAKKEYADGVEIMKAKPTMISLISTADCNIDCPGCSQNTVRLVRVQHRAETVPDVLEYVPYLYQFIWHGGEPFLIKRFRQFIDDFQTEDNPNLTFGFTSNGTMLTAKEFEKLQKFPRINASFSVDSFRKETFERIRKGADFEKVLANVCRAIDGYDAPTRVYSVGMIVCKSNLLELPANLQFAIDRDIGLNLSPVVIYPVTERLDVFRDFEVQTEGWREAIDAAKKVVAAAAQQARPSMRRVDPTGMVLEIERIFNAAAERHRGAAEIEFVVHDPHRSLSRMSCPGIILFDVLTNQSVAYCELDHGSGRYLLEVPGGHAPDGVYWALAHSLLEPSGWVVSGWFEHVDKRDMAKRFEDKEVLPALVCVPMFSALERPKNIHFSRYGESTPEGLNVVDPKDISFAYGQLVASERQSGGGLVMDGRGASVRTALSRIKRRVSQSLRRRA
jgi:radical SAM protein with 4Fe4S-binding SPASM domain